MFYDLPWLKKGALLNGWFLDGYFECIHLEWRSVALQTASTESSVGAEQVVIILATISNLFKV